MTFSEYKPLRQQDLDVEQEVPSILPLEQPRRPSRAFSTFLVFLLLTSHSFNILLAYQKFQL